MNKKHFPFISSEGVRRKFDLIITQTVSIQIIALYRLIFIESAEQITTDDREFKAKNYNCLFVITSL